MIVEAVERRIFGAVELVDDLGGLRLREPLPVQADGVTLQHKAGGLFVLRSVDGQDDYSRAFDDPPTQPPRSSFVFQVRDPRGRWLARAATVSLPRWLPAPGQPVDDADNALRAQSIRLYPGPAAVLVASAAVLRLRVEAGGQGLCNVLVEALPDLPGQGPRITWTDAQGEALLALPGVPHVLADPGPGPHGGLTRDFSVALNLVLDPEVVRAVPVGSQGTTKLPLPDPDRIRQRRDAATPGVRVDALAPHSLSAGASRRRVETVTWP